MNIKNILNEEWIHEDNGIGSFSDTYFVYDKETEKIITDDIKEKEIAVLISCAPEMLEALIYFIKRVNEGSIRSKTTYAKYIKIVEKATGQKIEDII